jgi:hypothetical protein
VIAALAFYDQEKEAASYRLFYRWRGLRRSASHLHLRGP